VSDACRSLRTISASSLNRTWKRCEQSVEELIAQFADSLDICISILGSETSCSHHRDNAGNVLGA
jgi:hypothetical protein